MQTNFLSSVGNHLRAANRWLLRTPERALNEAYEAALRIKSLEDAHFGGNRISVNSGNYSKSAQTYFQGELKKYLDIIKLRLIEFKASRSIVRLSNQSVTEIQLNETATDLRTISVIDQPSLVLKRLKLIDEVLARYEAPDPRSLIIVSESNELNSRRTEVPLSSVSSLKSASESAPVKRDMNSITDKTGILPRSILETIDRLRRDLDLNPEAEQKVVQDFHVSKNKTRISVRLVLLMIIAPLLTQQVSKNFVVGPIIDHFRSNPTEVSFLNTELEEEALNELQQYEQRLRFEILIGEAEPINNQEIDARMKEKAAEIKQQYHQLGSDAIKNVFSDLLGLGAFALVLLTNRREIAVLKSFMDQLIYGLSDSAKAFIIILFTDIFVGFHSPHGWEVLLEGVSRHLGLPANHNFIFLFIATFPVILDTIFKYWIFRYLNRVSPSAVATYKNMNE